MAIGWRISVYHGITHHIPMWLLGLWRRVCCQRGWHAFDEVMTLERHYLYCDACGLVVHIWGIDKPE